MNQIENSVRSRAVASRQRLWPGFVLGLACAAVGMLVWVGLVDPRPAYAQVPDSGKQRQIMIAELQTANKQLGQVVKLLTEIRNQDAGEAKPDGGKK